MNIKMWGQALHIIPRISKEEWNQLDIISKWLISTRAAVLVMKFLSASLAGIFAFRAGQFNWVLWFLFTFDLVMVHAANNPLNYFRQHF